MNERLVERRKKNGNKTGAKDAYKTSKNKEKRRHYTTITTAITIRRWKRKTTTIEVFNEIEKMNIKKIFEKTEPTTQMPGSMYNNQSRNYIDVAAHKKKRKTSLL